LFRSFTVFSKSASEEATEVTSDDVVTKSLAAASPMFVFWRKKNGELKKQQQGDSDQDTALESAAFWVVFF